MGKAHYQKGSQSSQTFADLQHFMYQTGYDLLPGIRWLGSVDEIMDGVFVVRIDWEVAGYTTSVSATYDQSGPESRRPNAIRLWMAEQIGARILKRAAERRHGTQLDGEAVEG